MGGIRNPGNLEGWENKKFFPQMGFLKFSSKTMQNSQENRFWIEGLLRDFTEETVPKSDFFLRLGDKPNRIAYIKSGFFVLVGRRNELPVVRDFLFEEDFLGSYGSILTGDPIQYDIQAREDSKILVGNVNRILESHEHILEYLKFSKYFLEYVYLQKEEREGDFLLMNVEEKLIRFREKYEKNLRRIPVVDIASYLGITLSTYRRLSRHFQK